MAKKQKAEKEAFKHQQIYESVKERLDKYCDNLIPRVGKAEMASHIISTFLKEEGY